MHACLDAHLLDPMPSQACISLFTNLSLQSVRLHSEAMTFTQSTVPAQCFSPSASEHQNHSQSVQVANTYMNEKLKLTQPRNLETLTISFKCRQGEILLAVLQYERED